jgi:MFS family permease
LINKSFYYLIIAAILGVAAIALIPKEKYKKLFIYGLLFGGLGDTIIVTLFSKIFPLYQYKNMGAFNILGLFSIGTPITWTFVFAIFLYLLPVRKVFLVPYIITFLGFNVAMGMVMHSLGLFEYNKPLYQYLDLIDFTLWYIIAAWIYIKAERIPLQ